MHVDQQSYRGLYESLLEYQGSAVYEDVIRRWLRHQDGERLWLREFAGRQGQPVPPCAQEESWRLYALSRISDLLLLSFAPWGADDPDTWTVPPVSLEGYVRFMESLGFQRIERRGFHPFFHEVVSVEPSDDPETEIEIVHDHWPGFMLGPMMFSRAGCRVRGGSRHIVKEIAEGSTLYWAFARHTRPTQDLSAGWGRSSQWRTSFRRDYQVDGVLFYNVDGDGRERDEDLSPEERLELLRHRCFVRCPKPHDDLFPYGERYQEAGP